MKKKILLLTMFLSVCLISCGKETNTQPTNTEPVVTEAPTAEPTEVPTPEPTEAPNSNLKDGITENEDGSYEYSEDFMSSLQTYDFFDGAGTEDIKRFLEETGITPLLQFTTEGETPYILEAYGENGRTIWDYIGTPPTVGTDEAPQQTQAPQETEPTVEPEKPVEQQPQSTPKPTQQPVQQPQEVPGTNNVEAFQDKLKDWGNAGDGGPEDTTVGDITIY